MNTLIVLLVSGTVGGVMSLALKRYNIWHNARERQKVIQTARDQGFIAFEDNYAEYVKRADPFRAVIYGRS